MKYLPRSRTTVAALGIVALLMFSRSAGGMNPRRRINRRGIFKLAGVSLAALVTGSWRHRLTVWAAPEHSLVDAPHCVLSPEMTQGPYYVAREKLRSNIREHKPGTALQLRLTVVDANTCAPIKRAAVDIWHCDAGGIYSGFIRESEGGPPAGGGPSDKHTFLRGIQLTDARGRAVFQTIYPGWYHGRTVHIHVMVHVGGTVGHIVHTGQLFFSDALTSKVYGAGAYKARAAERDTFNSNDSIYADGGARSMLTMKHDGHGGFIGTITLGVQRT